MWLIYFEDAYVPPEIFTSEAVARKRYEELLERWAVHLFEKVGME